MRGIFLAFLLMVAISPVCGQERYYYVGPSVTVLEDIGTVRKAPTWSIDSIDISSNATDLMFLVADKPQEAKGYVLLGTDPNEILKPETVIEWSKATGITVEGSDHALYGLLMDALTVHADPTRATAPKPIMPTSAGDVVLNLDGQTILIDKYAQADPAYKSLVVEVVQEDYRDIRTDSLSKDSDTYLKYLSVKAAQLGVSSDALIPADLPKEQPVKPQTTIGDTFVDTNGTALASHTATGTGGGFSWSAELAGLTGLLINNTNSLYASATTDTGVHRAESALSSDDMYCEVTITQIPTTSSRTVYVATRFNSGSYECYFFAANDSAALDWRLMKRTGGSLTQVGSTVTTPDVTNGDVMRCVIDGSSLSGVVDGVTVIGPTTDTAITGNTRAGVAITGVVTGVAELDGWVAADLYADPTPTPTPETGRTDVFGSHIFEGKVIR
jgi:hypothetical protein